ncbi:MAG: transcriptional regulator NrdR [Geobacteraceae bacterium GWC2_55_20]|jgi:transcriptional repressor NrdR|nr:transcriptional regulator NrdR [Deltaproteobacteria bacterium]OGU01512.1 MAG: transcriptional regulator NrdR [Geobacteraceae bacterium GWC2_55_20]OGU19133.1 MAG: transcriptional regulator NrdR [Geobacteraceae bacterium GWF2_54_21]HBA71085.1 transcriptional regulator NrdR [Geobacter sp.]HCE65974.1 transcriptional regulator NrdR [Geobacter sp.]
MKCPFCNNLDSKVVDSRPDKGGSAIRRRRECEQCSKRFTTHERIEEMLPQVCKKDGRREPFDRIKIINGIVKACEKRPISKTDIELVVDRLEARLQESTEREISTTTIGEWVMKELHGMDEVAYVRFASVYRSFRDISEFMQELQELLKK